MLWPWLQIWRFNFVHRVKLTRSWTLSVGVSMWAILRIGKDLLTVRISGTIGSGGGSFRKGCVDQSRLRSHSSIWGMHPALSQLLIVLILYVCSRMGMVDSQECFRQFRCWKAGYHHLPWRLALKVLISMLLIRFVGLLCCEMQHWQGI